MLDKIKLLIGQPIGVALKNGLSVSGVLCKADEDEICLMEYLFQARFIQKYYTYEQIQGIYIFPSSEKELLN
ncbi:hypothetical protein D1B33_05885 [Lysinibacillus yapensis]|uniref:Uncharacterized protein n=1 Tax=Ureibacillus yapensis TaxID=2304605 RepID=A0A396SQH5_9BACL|nr:hypothetical protein [Lysinibacillus yapensis]RHW38409.1 hypothetical protein D1B33_05885 [Lysinibacillus yapensis]